MNSENTQNEETQQAAEAETEATRKAIVIGVESIASASSRSDEEVIRDLVSPNDTDDSEEDDPRSPGMQDRTIIVPIPAPQPADQPAKEPETIRKRIVPGELEPQTETDDPRSPGMQDRDAIVPDLPSEESEVEVVRKLIIPPTEPESDNKTTGS